MADITGQNILDENGWTTPSTTIIEYFIDNSINYINSEAGLSISNMSGAAGSKSVTVTSAQAPIIKALTALYVKAYKDRGPSVNLGSFGISAVLQDPQYALFSEIVKSGINRLRSRSILRT